jgi:endonuclease/exonuclease/phosphatase (EEP) superfamily protein YafD
VSPSHAPRDRRPRPRWLAGRAAIVGLLTAPTLAVTTALAAPVAHAAPRTDGSDITIVQANLMSPQHYTRFQKDAAEVFGQGPDLITFNEVAFRHDSFLAPKGYELWRTPGQYTGPTPVAWRTSEWTMLDAGTWQISNYRKRPPGKKTRLGLRHANWVTLQSVDGRVLSVVSAHISPTFKDGSGKLVDLLKPSVRRLNRLVEQLGSHGPVLVGGDFNVHYKSGRYPRQLFNSSGLQPTYDLMGNYFPTGDHGGHTIDYLFLRGADQLQVDDHYPVELRSDHDAVVAGLSWTADPVSTTEVVTNDPAGTRPLQRAVANRVASAVNGTEAGEKVQVVTRGLSLQPVFRALKRAHLRGVSVQLTTLSPRLTERERWLRTLFAGRADSWVQRCRAECASSWSAAHPPSELLLSGADGRPELQVEVSRRLRGTVITRRTTAVLRSGPKALAAARRAFSRL